MGIVYWIHLTEGWGQWRVFVTTVNEPSVSKKCEKILNYMNKYTKTLFYALVVFLKQWA